MGYLVTHIAISLVIAQLLGLLLGWLLWGYPARQQAKQVGVLQERVADLQRLTPMVTAGKAGFAPAPYTSLPLVQSPSTESLAASVSLEVLSGTVSGNARAESSPRSQLEREPEAVEPLPAVNGLVLQPDLEAEIKEARLRYFEEQIRLLEQQIRELEGARDRLPALQAALSVSLAAREAAESEAAKVRSEFEARVSDLLAQVHTFERAAQEWDLTREKFELDSVTNDKELARVRARLRDLQNVQLPQKAELLVENGEHSGLLSALEAADLRDRYQRVVTERDAIAAKLEHWKQQEGSRFSDSQRLSELTETLRLRDANLAGQVARVESLLWRVAELEPLAEAVPRMEEERHRLEVEIAGHLAMHSESSEHIRKLLNRVAELEGLSNRAAEREAALRHTLAESKASLQSATAALENKDKEHREAVETLAATVRELEQARTGLNAEVKRLAQVIVESDANIKQLAQRHETELSELQQTIERKDLDIKGHEAARAEQAKYAVGLETRISALEERARWALELEKTLSGKEAELSELQQTIEHKDVDIKGHKAARAEQAKYVDGLETRISALEERASWALELEKTLSGKEAELGRLAAAGSETQAQLDEWKKRAAEAQRTQQAQAAEMRAQLTALEERHQAEMSRLKINLAQRVRRLRQAL